MKRLRRHKAIDAELLNESRRLGKGDCEGDGERQKRGPESNRNVNGPRGSPTERGAALSASHEGVQGAAPALMQAGILHVAAGVPCALLRFWERRNISGRENVKRERRTLLCLKCEPT